ncbi:MAG TPA: hypothetical protein VNA20_09710 [Frankiaceae bacterium]|nr:hypothetical protein [Frankiaceae bacterium]
MAGRALPERALAGLRDAFAGEVALRLPGMQSACAEVLATGATDAVQTLITHAHTLASSAAVLGETLASRHARHCEELLLGCAGGVVSRAVATEAAADVEAVSLLLAPWLVAA